MATLTQAGLTFGNGTTMNEYPGIVGVMNNTILTAGTTSQETTLANAGPANANNSWVTRRTLTFIGKSGTVLNFRVYTDRQEDGKNAYIGYARILVDGVAYGQVQTSGNRVYSGQLGLGLNNGAIIQLQNYGQINNFPHSGCGVVAAGNNSPSLTLLCFNT